MRQGCEDLDGAVDDPEDAQQQRQGGDGHQNVSQGVQPDDERQRPQQGQHPGRAGLVVGRQRGHEPEDPGHHLLDAEQHGQDHNGSSWPDEGEDAGQQGDDAEGEHPAPVPADVGKHVGGVGP